MRKKTVLLLMLMVGAVFADVDSLSQDILKQITHGAVNTNPDISDDVADQSVVLSLKAASLSLACIQKNRSDQTVSTNCISNNKGKLVTSPGSMDESAFNIGQLAAQQQAKIHREVKVSDYYQVINTLMIYAKNLYQSDINKNYPLQSNSNGN